MFNHGVNITSDCYSPHEIPATNYFNLFAADQKAHEVESVSRDLEKKLSMKAKPRKEEVITLRKAQEKAAGCRKLAAAKKEAADFKRKYVFKLFHKIK